MKNVTFVPKDVQRILSSHKIVEMYKKRKAFHERAALRYFAIFTRKHLCWSLVFDKNTELLPCNVIKK